MKIEGDLNKQILTGIIRLNRIGSSKMSYEFGLKLTLGKIEERQWKFFCKNAAKSKNYQRGKVNMESWWEVKIEISGPKQQSLD